MRAAFLLAILVLLGTCGAVQGGSKPPRKLLHSDTKSIPWFTLTYSDADGFVVREGVADTDAVAYGQFNASLYDLGWDYVRMVAPDDLVEDDLPGAYFAAGYLEGYLTSSRITGLGFSNLSADVNGWISDHIGYMYTKAGDQSSDPFWYQVELILRQVEGLTAGYNNATSSNITFLQMFIISFGAEVGDVVTALQVQSGAVKRNTLLDRRGVNSHCSALIKVTHDDLFMAHDTWNSFYGLQWRMYKVYEFQTTVTMSGYVASVASGDDWYMTSNELTIQETTNIVWNSSLYVNVVPETVSEFIRVMTATYLATSGEEWTAYFARENSGTYNNQYMVVDMKLYVPGSTVVDGTLWIAEQIPGYVARGDESKQLRQNGYWASYNIPYFREIYDISGYKAVEEQQGTFWSYTKYARPEIFRRNNTDITDVYGMMRMMRYNNYLYDPLSAIPNCTGAPNNVCETPRTSMLTIASRGDLMTVYNTTAENIAHYGPLYSWVAQGCFGATDSKIASWKNRRSLTGYIISGPTNDQQPTFRWGEPGVCSGPTPPGCATEFDFPWIAFIL